jgi:hypothetical protein
MTSKPVEKMGMRNGKDMIRLTNKFFLAKGDKRLLYEYKRKGEQSDRGSKGA